MSWRHPNHYSWINVFILPEHSSLRTNWHKFQYLYICNPCCHSKVLHTANSMCINLHNMYLWEEEKKRKKTTNAKSNFAVCSFSCFFGLIYRCIDPTQRANIWKLHRNMILTLSNGQGMCTAQSQCGLWLRHGLHCLRQYFCMDSRMKCDLWNYCQSGRTVRNIGMEEYTPTDNDP